MAGTTLGHFDPREKPPVLIFKEGEWIPEQRRSEEKSAPLRHSGSNPDRPACSQAPCRLSYLAHNYRYKALYNQTAPVAMYDGCGSVAFVYWLRLKQYL